MPTADSEREQQAQLYGDDGWRLLNAIDANTSPVWLRQVPAVETLRRVWVQQYYYCNARLRWRTKEDMPPASLMLSSPYDLDAHYARKQTTSWVDYKVHLSETCEPHELHLMTNVETTAGPFADGDLTQSIHASLANQNLLPDKHIVDTGYLDAE